jgi:hypothetical protein
MLLGKVQEDEDIIVEPALPIGIVDIPMTWPVRGG